MPDVPFPITTIGAELLLLPILLRAEVSPDKSGLCCWAPDLVPEPWFCAVDRRKFPFRGLPPNVGLTGLYTCSVARAGVAEAASPRQQANANLDIRMKNTLSKTDYATTIRQTVHFLHSGIQHIKSKRASPNELTRNILYAITISRASPL